MTWETDSGNAMQGVPGDWEVTDASGGSRTVTDSSFRASHRHIQGDVWERVAVVSARRSVPGEEVITQEGAAVAAAGDWRVRDADGEEWFVPDYHFTEAYRPIGDER